jgi:hypothetical protein
MDRVAAHSASLREIGEIERKQEREREKMRQGSQA